MLIYLIKARNRFNIFHAFIKPMPYYYNLFNQFYLDQAIQ